MKNARSDLEEFARCIRQRQVAFERLLQQERQEFQRDLLAAQAEAESSAADQSCNFFTARACLSTGFRGEEKKQADESARLAEYRSEIASDEAEIAARRNIFPVDETMAAVVGHSQSRESEIAFRSVFESTHTKIVAGQTVAALPRLGRS